MHAGRANLPKNRGVSPADIARQDPSIIIKNSRIQPSPSAGTTYTYFEPALLYKENRQFLLVPTLSFYFYENDASLV
jgi:hypothetical protein